MIAIYKRYSTEKQDLKTQDAEIANYLAYKNIPADTIEFFVDEAMSGTTTDRPAFQKMMSQVKLGKVTQIIALKLDRLSRSTRDLQNFLYELKQNNVDLIVVKDNIDTSTTHGKLFFDMMSSFVEYERSNLIDRMQSGIRRAKAEGKICNRPKKELNIARIVKLHDEHKLSFNSIKKIFEAEGTKVAVSTIIARYKEHNAHRSR